MAYIIEHNNVARDSYALRLARLILLSANIDDYSAELDVAAKLTWVQGAVAAWEAAMTDAGVEDGEMQEAFPVGQERACLCECRMGEKGIGV